VAIAMSAPVNRETTTNKSPCGTLKLVPTKGYSSPKIVSRLDSGKLPPITTSITSGTFRETTNAVSESTLARTATTAYVGMVSTSRAVRPINRQSRDRVGSRTPPTALISCPPASPR
jgi:hypothetical protein